VTTSGSNQVVAFRRALRRAAGSLERDLPWVTHREPWAVLVSEYMLQQTQVARVLGPWQRFLLAFPTPTSCADVPLSDVLRLWEGLGYHRRAKSLHDAAVMIRDHFAGAVPSEVEQLRSLPGVGEYTANAVASFAYNRPVAVLDTNVGRVLARALANRRLTAVQARALALELLGRSPSAPFNQAMLDLGSQFCAAKPRCATCPLARTCVWHRDGGPDPAIASAAVSRPQSSFLGSTRQLRGVVLRHLREGPQSKKALLAHFDDADAVRGEAALEGLVRDGLVRTSGHRLSLVGD